MNKFIPLVKPFIPPKEILMPELEKVLYSGYIAEGEIVRKFEESICTIIGNKFCLSVNSGTSALHLALILANVKTGDEVISTALTAEPTNTSIAAIGAKVIFADVDEKTGLISPKSIIEKISNRTKAIMIVHYAGMVCDLENINKISKKYRIPVIEDAAHAFYSKYEGQFIGNNSRFTIFSFQAIKHLTTVDGGMICLNNEADYARARALRWFGLDKTKARLNNNITEVGYKYNMNNVTATIGMVQLQFLESNVKRYIENGKYYDYQLKDIKDVSLIHYYKNTEPSYWLYTIRVNRRDKFIEMLSNNGITASPLHLRNDMHSIFQPNSELPKLDNFYKEFVHIPCGWWVTDEDRELIVSLIRNGW